MLSFIIINRLLKEKAQNLSVPSGRVKRFRCAFFNFSGGTDQTGGWSYRGLETEIINDTHIRCSASHLTTFVVLVSIIPTVRDPVSVTANNITYAAPGGTDVLLNELCSFLAACTGLHHIHWLQHFFALLACFHHILLIIKVS